MVVMNALIEFTGNHGYNEREIHKDFHINVTDGVITITIDEEKFEGDFTTGELLE